ncbi:hypothetical protein D3C84_1180650 [compost metagenome]
MMNRKLYVLSPEMALIAGLVENSWNSQPAASSTSAMVSSGLCSSHSPGRVRGCNAGMLKLGSMPQAAASRALFGPGAVA